MRTIVRKSPLDPPMIDTADANVVEVRDDAGGLVLVIAYNPGGRTFFVTDRNDQEFFNFCKEIGINPEPDKSNETKAPIIRRAQ